MRDIPWFPWFLLILVAGGIISEVLRAAPQVTPVIAVMVAASVCAIAIIVVWRVTGRR